MNSILQIVTAPASGGAENFVRDLSCELSSMGHNLHMAFIDRAIDLDRDEGFEREFLAQLKKNNVGYSFLGHETRKKPWLGAARLRRIVRAGSFDLVHSHLAYGNIFAAAIPRVPLVYTHHSENARFPRAYWKYFGLRVSRFIGISEICAKNLAHYVGRDVQIDLVQNGVNVDGISVRSSGSNFQADIIKAICVGRISKLKNYELLAKSVAALSSQHKQRLSVDIFGEGEIEIKEKCKNILANAGEADGTFCFKGATPKIRRILCDYDMFLMSSESEGLPIALIEATAAGLPTIVTDVGGCREVVEAGPSGYIVPPNDVNAYRDALQKMMDDPIGRETFSKNAVITARKFSISSTAERYAQIYKEVLEK